MSLRYPLLGVLLFLAGVAAATALTRWFIVHRTAVIARIVNWQQRLRARYPRAWKFLVARFARGEYLGLHLTVGLVIIIAAMWLFAAITEDVVRQESLTRFDVALYDWLRMHSTAAGHTITRVITRCGSQEVIAAMALVVAIGLVIRREGLLVEGWIIALLGGEVLSETLKRIIHRPRPPFSVILSSQSWSFPSGHAMESLVAYGMAAYLMITLLPGTRARRSVIILGATTLILAIGFSRMYLGVHYFSDVVGGFAAGALWLAMCISGLEVARGWNALDRAKRWGETA